MLCPWGQNDVFLGVWAWVTIVTDAASLSHLDSDRIKHVSRVGTHRPNEWEGRHGRRIAFHAARDHVKHYAIYYIDYEIDYIKTPSFRQAPNVYNVTIIDFSIDACVTHLSTERYILFSSIGEKRPVGLFRSRET
jgi:hypothetical protein